MKPKGLDDFTGPFRPSGDEVCYRNCPVCHDSRWKCYVNVESGWWICFAGNCSARGRVDVGSCPDALLRDLRPAAAPAVTWPEVELPEFTALDERTVRYFGAREFNVPVLRRYHVVSCTGARYGRACIPYFDRDGQVIYWSLRDLTGTAPQKYLNMPGRHPLYVPRFAHAAGRRLGPQVPQVVVVEGALDAIRVEEAGFSGVALGGKSLPRYLRRPLLDLVRDEITVLLDADALGAAVKLARDLRDQVGVRICVLPTGMDPASASINKLKEVLSWR